MWLSNTSILLTLAAVALMVGLGLAIIYGGRGTPASGSATGVAARPPARAWATLPTATLEFEPPRPAVAPPATAAALRTAVVSRRS